MSINSDLSFGVSSARIVDGTIVNADISASAAIAASKISGLAASATTDATNASNITSGTLAAARVATLNQNTTGTAANVTGTVAVLNGGTGATTAAAALTNLGAYAATNPSGYTTNTGTVTGVTATAPVASSGGTAPVISMVAASSGVNGYMTGAYATKLDGIATGATANTGTVTSVGGTGTVSGLTLSGTVTTTGSLTLGGTLAIAASSITSGTIDAARLPSYVDDVIEAANLAAFPATGETGKIYVALDTNKTYRWSGSAYVFITSGAVDSVAGKTGIVTLNSSDVGLANVDNTSDASKPVSTAQQTALDTKQATLVSGTTIKTVNSQSILGSGNIQIDGGVTSFNTRTGAVALSSGDVTDALTYTPVNKAGDTVTGDLLNSAAYSAPNNASGAGTKLIIRGSTGTGAAGASGGHGHVEILGGDATTPWTSFSSATQTPRRGGIVVQAGKAQGDAGNTYVNGSALELYAGNGTNNGTTVGNGGRVILQSGQTTKTDSQTSTGGVITLEAGRGTDAGSFSIQSGNFDFGSLQYGRGSAITGSRAFASSASSVTISGGAFTTGFAQNLTENTGGRIEVVGGTATTGGSIVFTPGTVYSGIAGGTNGTVKVGTNVILHAGNYNSYAPSLTGSGASGTWSISISGNAATASNGGVTSVNGQTGAVTVSAGSGTVTGVTGTAPVVSTGGTAPVISMAAASSGVDGYMTGVYATKLDGIAAGATANTGTVTGVTGTAPIVSSGGTAPAISISAATTSAAGSMSSADKSKLDGIASGATNVTNNNQLTNGAGYTTNTGTVTSVATGTGLSGGTITTSGTISLADTAVSAGSYTSANITVDAQGRITAASNGSGGGGGSGTVTSVAATVPAFLSVAGSPITTSGTLAITLSGTALPVANGGTGLTSYTTNGLVYASGTGTLATDSALTFNGIGLALSGSGSQINLSNVGASGGLYMDYGTGANDFYITFDGSGNTQYTVATGRSHAWFVASTEKMYLNSNGLGVNGAQASSLGRLSVEAGGAANANSVYLTNFDGTYNTSLQIRHSSSGITLYNNSAGAASASNILSFSNGTVGETMSISGSGNVNVIAALTQNNNQVLHAGNYTSYSPSLTGSGASGTWGISISGNATTATTATNVSGGLVSSARINSRTSTTASAATIDPNIASFDQYNLTAQSTALTINAPSANAVDGNKLTFRILDNGTARAITWNATYVAIGVSLPATTVANKTTYIGCVFNANNTRWDVIAVGTQA